MQVKERKNIWFHLSIQEYEKEGRDYLDRGRENAHPAMGTVFISHPQGKRYKTTGQSKGNKSSDNLETGAQLSGQILPCIVRDAWP